MSDDFLDDLREEPRPEFKERLAARLQTADESARQRGAGRGRPLLAGAFAIAAAALAFTLPPVRAAAREFLDLFRVQRFAAVPVDLERIARSEQQGLDLKAAVGSQVEFLEQPVEPAPADDAEAAAALGMELRRPKLLPEKTEATGITVGRPGAFRVRLDVAKLRALADALGAGPAEVPDSWDGATVEVHAPPVVAMRYHRGDGDFVFLQSHGPQVALPEGVDLPQLGALGLQMAGMSAPEARLFARSIDWRTTLLVPIPAHGGSFREVEVNGRKGLIVSSRARTRAEDGSWRLGAWQSVLLWADADRVYAATGPGHGIELLQLAQSIE